MDQPVAGVVGEGRDRAAGDGGMGEVSIVIVNGGRSVYGGKPVICVDRESQGGRMVDARGRSNVFAGDFAVGIECVKDIVKDIRARREVVAPGNLPGGVVTEGFYALVRASDGGDPAVGIVSVGGDPVGPVGHRGEAARRVVAVGDLLLAWISEGSEIAGAVIGVSQDLARRVGESDQPTQEIVLAADGFRRARDGLHGPDDAPVVVIRIGDCSDRIDGGDRYDLDVARSAISSKRKRVGD